jgi:hypothetical protein
MTEKEALNIIRRREKKEQFVGVHILFSKNCLVRSALQLQALVFMIICRNIQSYAIKECQLRYPRT